MRENIPTFIKELIESAQRNGADVRALDITDMMNSISDRPRHSAGKSSPMTAKLNYLVEGMSVLMDQGQQILKCTKCNARANDKESSEEYNSIPKMELDFEGSIITFDDPMDDDCEYYFYRGFIIYCNDDNEYDILGTTQPSFHRLREALIYIHENPNPPSGEELRTFFHNNDEIQRVAAVLGIGAYNSLAALVTVLCVNEDEEDIRDVTDIITRLQDVINNRSFGTAVTEDPSEEHVEEDGESGPGQEFDE